MTFLKDYIDQWVDEGLDAELCVFYEDGVSRSWGWISCIQMPEGEEDLENIELLDGYYPELNSGDEYVDIYVKGVCQDSFLTVQELLEAIERPDGGLAHYTVHLTSASDGDMVFGAVDDWRFDEYASYLVLSHCVTQAQDSRLGVDTVTIVCE